MSARQKVIARMKAQLDAWSAELHDLEAKLDHVEAGTRDRYRRIIAELRQMREAAESRLEELKEAGEETWEEAREEAERTWTAFKAGVDAVRDFSDHS
jgi:hypothetical protein